MTTTPIHALACAALLLGPSVGAALAAATPAATPAAAPATSAASPVVATDKGRVEGRVDDGVASWKGMPFAAAPVGPLRWRAPQPVAAWSGVRPAAAYANDCMQLPFPSDAAPLGTPPAEDCLYLNVWKPAAAPAAAGTLPVIVWIYGGGFVNGGSSPPTYSGAALARQGALVVSFNYRLGRFGFFGHPQLTREDADAGLLGNYGFMDQLAALRWVRANAAAFGGDPANVTIVGESAGGMSVHTLMTSPLADGLFAKAVILSGGDGGADDGGIPALERAGVAFGAARGIDADDPRALARLRALAPEGIVDGMNLANRPQATPPTYVGPVADGKLAVVPVDAYRAGRARRLPVMIGATGADIGGKTGFMVAGARRLAGLLADEGWPVYAYRFSYIADSIPDADKKAGAQHASDIPYFFDTVAVKYGDAASPKDVRMGHAMGAYLVNFARRGDPNGAGLPAWPRYARARDVLIDFGADGAPLALKDPWGREIDAPR